MERSKYALRPWDALCLHRMAVSVYHPCQFPSMGRAPFTKGALLRNRKEPTEALPGKFMIRLRRFRLLQKWPDPQSQSCQPACFH